MHWQPQLGQAGLVIHAGLILPDYLEAALPHQQVTVQSQRRSGIPVVPGGSYEPAMAWTFHDSIGTVQPPSGGLRCDV